MHIRIYLQPDNKDTVWAKMSRKAVAAEILRKRYTAEYLETSSVTDIDFDKVFAPDEKRVLLYIGTHYKKTMVDLQHLAEHNVHTILLNNGGTSYSGSCSRVRINFCDAIEKAIAYLLANGRDRIALFGVNPNSPSDKLQKERFSEYLYATGKEPQKDIYYNYASIQDCYANFASHHTAYNAVICVNDVTALTLLRRLKADGVRVPEDMYILSCGLSSILAERPSTPITTVSADRSEIGGQAVLAYSILAKNAGDIALTLQVAAKFNVRASTDYAPVPQTLTPPPSMATYSTVDFFADPVTQNFYNAENLLAHCDDLDHNILDGILAGQTYHAIAERLFTSGNMISYRVKRMCRLAGCAGKNELIATLLPYLE